MLRFMTAGESHGPGLVTIVEGLPRGLEVSIEGIATELARRRLGFGRGNRMAIEKDGLEILGGVRHGTTLGSPVAVVVRNTEWPRWAEEMSPEPAPTRKAVTRPRPGHADLAGMLKYGTDDGRDILERASARETAARTVAGHLAKTLLRTVDVEVISHVVAIGQVESQGPTPLPADLDAIDASPVRCFDEESTAAMVELIEDAKEQRDTLGGVFEVLAYGVPAGIGSHVHYDRRLDGMLAVGADVHPCDQGRRDRRRIRGRPSPRLEVPRRDRGRRLVGGAADQPGRWHRGWDQQRRGDQGESGDEADLDADAPAADGRHEHR